MSQLIFLAPSGGTVTVTNADTASNTNMTLPAANGTLLYVDSSNTLTVPNLTVTGLPLFTGTTALGLPVGSGTQRPVSPTVGEIRYCTDAGGFFEGYEAGNWRKFTTTALGLYSINYLIVAGGGGGSGSDTGGGGGGGGLLTGSVTLTPGTVYNLIVGAGGANQAQGVASSFLVGVVVVSQTVGGGFGGTYAGGSGGSGGSGGGGAYSNPDGSSGIGSGGSGTSGQGNAGSSGGTFNTFCGGGGGAGAIASGGNGATGLVNTLTGTSVFYAGGGAGFPGGSTGGAGGGGNPRTNGGANTGGGAGGGGAGATGGSGVVILSIPTANYSGTVTGSPTVTTNGSFTVVRYTTSGTYTA
jgi:hypothetical protein